MSNRPDQGGPPEGSPSDQPSEKTVIVDVPKHLGVFRLTRLLGRGGMGEVWEAFDTNLERHVAVKLMRKELLTNDEATRRFAREARAVARLNHPNIVQVYTFGDDSGVLYFVMELVEGDTITGHMKQTRTLPLEQAVSVVHQAIEGLSYAYARGIIHRDIKPSNLMCTPEKRIKIADFGLAKIIEHDTQVTAAGTTMGSPNYMSPEQARGEEADHRSDIYALGISFYQMLTGELPFNSTSPLTVLLKQIQDPLPEPPELKTLADGRVLAVIKKMTEKHPDQRYQSYDGLAAAVDSLLPGQRFHGSHVPTISYPKENIDSPDVPPQEINAIPVGSLDATRSHSPAEGFNSPPPSPPAPKARRPNRAVWAAAIALVAIIAAIALWQMNRPTTGASSITPGTASIRPPELTITPNPAPDPTASSAPSPAPTLAPTQSITPTPAPTPVQPANIATPPPVQPTAATVTASEIVLGSAETRPGSNIPLLSLDGRRVASLPAGSRLPLIKSQLFNGKTHFVVQHAGTSALVPFDQAQMLRAGLNSSPQPTPAAPAARLSLGTVGAPPNEQVPVFLDERGLAEYRRLPAGTEVIKTGETITMTKVALPDGKEVYVYKKMAQPK